MTIETVTTITLTMNGLMWMWFSSMMTPANNALSRFLFKFVPMALAFLSLFLVGQRILN